MYETIPFKVFIIVHLLDPAYSVLGAWDPECSVPSALDSEREAVSWAAVSASASAGALAFVEACDGGAAPSVTYGNGRQA